MEIIGISGKAENGKDETAKILKYKLENFGKKVLIMHHASYLKFIAKEYFSWDGNKNPVGRSLLQKIGEDARKIDIDYWVKVVYNFIEIFGNQFDYIIIPDLRFLNEITYLEDCGLDVTTLRVNRLNFESSLTEEQRNHISEIELDNYNFDFYIYPDNNLGIEDLERCIDELLSD